MISKNTLSEVYEVLSYMDKETVMKIPLEILQYIKDNRNINYHTTIDKNDIFNLKNITTDTINVLAWIDINYWMDSKKRTEIENIYSNKRLKEYHSTNEIFSKNNQKNSFKLEKQLTVKPKNTFIKRIIINIKRLFNVKKL